jgi:integrase
MASASKRGTWWRGRYKNDKGVWDWVSRDEDGQRFKTKTAARAAAVTLEEKAKQGTFISPKKGRTPFREWSQTWLAGLDVGPVSERGYRSRLNAVILPEWGDVAVGDINTAAVKIWEKKLRAGYSPNSVSGFVSLFRTMLDDAIPAKLRSDNPVPTRKSGRRGKFTPPPPTDEAVIATPRQALLFARNAMELRGLSFYVQALTHAYCGLRIGEAAGLARVQPLLTDAGQGARILLQGQSQYVGGKPTVIGAKYGSDRGPGGLILPPFLAVLLRELAASHGGDFMFTAPQGGRLLASGGFYTDSWRPCAAGRAAVPGGRNRAVRTELRPVTGVEAIVPHGMRHSMKVWLDEALVPRVAVEERMGHKLPGVEGTYSHTTLAMELKLAEVLQSLWERSIGEPDAPGEYGPVPQIP